MAEELIPRAAVKTRSKSLYHVCPAESINHSSISWSVILSPDSCWQIDFWAEDNMSYFQPFECICPISGGIIMCSEALPRDRGRGGSKNDHWIKGATLTAVSKAPGLPSILWKGGRPHSCNLPARNPPEGPTPRCNQRRFWDESSEAHPPTEVSRLALTLWGTMGSLKRTAGGVGGGL